MRSKFKCGLQSDSSLARKRATFSFRYPNGPHHRRLCSLHRTRRPTPPRHPVMASAVLASSVAVRGTPLAPTAAGKRTPVRAVRGRAVVTRAGEIAGLTECGKFQELCKAEIPGKIPRCVVFFACMAKVVQGVQCLDTTETAAAAKPNGQQHEGRTHRPGT